MMKFVSSRNKNKFYSSKEAIIKGLAEDGGLFTPFNFTENIFSTEKFLNLSYQKIALKILSFFFDDFSEEELKKCTHKAYDNKFSSSEITPTYKISDNIHLLELFHGPTSAFKDIALTILPHLLVTADKNSTRKIHILTATSGDTGKAALEGFKNIENIYITVFYPHKKVSLIQERQMNTTNGNNVEVISVNGNFDDCQKLVKDCYEKISDESITLSSANSINIGRLVPQIVYYFKAYCELVNKNEVKLNEKVNFVVPTGNFGNILAGYLAKILGCPINKLICVSNKNNVLTDFIETGIYDRNREFFTTLSPSMDILVSSNLERLLFMLSSYDDIKIKKYMEDLNKFGKYKIDNDLLSKIQDSFKGYYCSEEDCKRTIKEVFEKKNKLIDTHTAIAYYAAKKHQKTDKTLNIVLATASPFKFCNNILEALLNKTEENEFNSLRILENLTHTTAPKNLKDIENLSVVHNKNIEKENGIKTVLERIGKIK